MSATKKTAGKTARVAASAAKDNGNAAVAPVNGVDWEAEERACGLAVANLEEADVRFGNLRGATLSSMSDASVELEISFRDGTSLLVRRHGIRDDLRKFIVHVNNTIFDVDRSFAMDYAQYLLSGAIGERVCVVSLSKMAKKMVGQDSNVVFVGNKTASSFVRFCKVAGKEVA